MKTNRNQIIIFGMLFILLLIGCNRDKKEWSKANSENTIESFKKFIKDFPESKYVLEATKKIDSLYTLIELHEVVIDGKHGYINNKGELVISCNYANAFDFSGNYALVRDTAWGIINKSGEYVIKPEFDEISDFSEGLAAVKKDNKWGYMDSTGKLVIPYTFDDAWTFSDKKALVKKDDNWGFVDNTGNFVIQAKYPKAYIYDQGTLLFLIDSEGHLTKILSGKNNKKIIKNKFEYLTRKTINFGFGTTTYWEYENINKSKTTSDTSYLCIDEFINGVARIIVNHKWGYIDASGNYLLKPEYDYCSLFNDGFASFRKDGLTGYIDKTGKIIIEPKYEMGSVYREGFAIAQLKNASKLTYIDKTGKEMTEMNLKKAASFSEELAGICVNDKWGFIDRNFNIVIQHQFDDVTPFEKGLAKVEMKEKWGMINKKGEIVIPCKYSRIETNGTLYYATENEISSFIDNTGKEIWKEKPATQK